MMILLFFLCFPFAGFPKEEKRSDVGVGKRELGASVGFWRWKRREKKNKRKEENKYKHQKERKKWGNII